MSRNFNSRILFFTMLLGFIPFSLAGGGTNFISVSVNPDLFLENQNFTGILANVNATENYNCPSLVINFNNSNTTYSFNVTMSNGGTYWYGNFTVNQNFLNKTKFGTYRTGTAYCGNLVLAISANNSSFYFKVNDTEGPDWTQGQNESVVTNQTNITFQFWDPSNVTNITSTTNASSEKVWTSGEGTQNANITLQFNVSESEDIVINITTIDAWDNTNNYTFYTVVDLDPPQIQNTSLDLDFGNSSFGPWVPPIFNISANISDRTNTTCWVEMANQTQSEKVSETFSGKGNVTIQVNASNLESGNYALILNCIDYVGNNASSEMNVSLDNSAPSITWLNQEWITNETSMTIAVNASDYETGVSQCNITWTGGTYVMNQTGQEWMYNITGLTDGDYTLNVSCWDKVENKVRETRNLIVDLIPPSMNYTYLTTNSTIRVNMSINDAHLNYTTISVGGQECNSSNSTFSCTFPGLENNKEYNISIIAYDMAGNYNKTSLAIRTKANPIASFTATPTSGYAPLKVSFDASGSFDPDGNITSYEWDFGDGTNASGKQVSHTFQSSGNYVVLLKVTDNENYTGFKTIGITVNVKNKGHHGHGGGGGWIAWTPPEQENKTGNITNMTNINATESTNATELNETNSTKMPENGTETGGLGQGRGNEPEQSQKGPSVGTKPIIPVIPGKMAKITGMAPTLADYWKVLAMAVTIVFLVGLILVRASYRLARMRYRLSRRK